MSDRLLLGLVVCLALVGGCLSGSSDLDEQSEAAYEAKAEPVIRQAHQAALETDRAFDGYWNDTTDREQALQQARKAHDDKIDAELAFRDIEAPDNRGRFHQQTAHALTMPTGIALSAARDCLEDPEDRPPVCDVADRRLDEAVEEIGHRLDGLKNHETTAAR